MSTKLKELRDGCFARAMDDEPMFVLLARDTRAAQHVRDWATQRRADISLGKKPATDMAQVEDAFRTADAMEAWREENDGAWRAGLFADEAMRNTGGEGVLSEEEMERELNEARYGALGQG